MTTILINGKNEPDFNFSPCQDAAHAWSPLGEGEAASTWLTFAIRSAIAGFCLQPRLLLLRLFVHVHAANQKRYGRRGSGTHSCVLGLPFVFLKPVFCFASSFSCVGALALFADPRSSVGKVGILKLPEADADGQNRHRSRALINFYPACPVCNAVKVLFCPFLFFSTFFFRAHFAGPNTLSMFGSHSTKRVMLLFTSSESCSLVLCFLSSFLSTAHSHTDGQSRNRGG